MSAADLIRTLSNGAFLLLALGTIVRFARDPRRETWSAALFFSALAVIVGAGVVLPLMNVTDARLTSLLTLVPVLALPVLELQLVGAHARLRPRAIPLAIVGFVASAAAVILFDPVPSPLALPVILYFFLTSVYAAFALVREARAAPGPARARVRLGAAGAFLLGLVLLTALLGAFSAELADVAAHVSALASALAFAGAFSPPPMLERAWREPWIRRLLTRGSHVVARPTLQEAIAELERAIADTMGARTSAIQLLPGADSPATLSHDDAERLTALAAAATRLDRTGPGRVAEDGGALLAVPMDLESERVGAVALRFDRPPMFLDATSQMLQLVAVNAAVLVKASIAMDGLRRRNDALDEANRIAQEATRAKSEFLANMSHELRTPLNSILGFADLLTEQLGPAMNERQAKVLRNIRDAGDHLLRLVNEVLDLSKVEARRVELRRETITLDTLVGEVTSSISAEAKRRGLEFVVDVPGSVIVFVDPLRGRQILLNLLSNAVKFTPAPGRVTLAAHVDADSLVIQVSDTGIGIPADKVGRVFGSFERLHEGRYEAQGTGLGLALSKQLVELHGGTIDFVTAEGKGTTFAVRMPGVVVADAADRILVVEDESRDADLIVALAKREGLAADVAAGVESARRALRQKLPLALIVDLRLPDGRGEDVLRELDALAADQHVPTIVVTVEDDDGGSRLRGADDHLTKPLDHERLAGWLRQVATRAKDRHAHSSR